MSRPPPVPKPVVCRKCGVANPPGVMRCEQCKASLRPLALGAICLLGVLGSILLAIGCLWCWMSLKEWSVLAIYYSVGIAVGTFQTILYWELGHGAWWAWITTQILLGLSVIGDMQVITWASHQVYATAGMVFGFTHLFLALIFIGYLQMKRVRAFCGARVAAGPQPGA